MVRFKCCENVSFRSRAGAHKVAPESHLYNNKNIKEPQASRTL